MSKSELELTCEAMGIKVVAAHIGLDAEVEEGGKNWVYDRWSCTLEFDGRSASFEYKTGIGHRVLAPNVKRSGEKFWFEGAPHTARSSHEAALKNMLILPRHKSDKDGNVRGSLKGPSVADLIHSIGLDSTAMDTTFDDWCDEFGYSNDSLRSLNLYLACQRNGKKLAMLLGYGKMAELRNQEH